MVTVWQSHLTWYRRGTSVRTADRPGRQLCPRYQTPATHTHTKRHRFEWLLMCRTALVRKQAWTSMWSPLCCYATAKCTTWPAAHHFLDGTLLCSNQTSRITVIMAQAGAHYHSQKKNIKAAHACVKSLKLSLINNNNWDSTEMIVIKLASPTLLTESAIETLTNIL